MSRLLLRETGSILITSASHLIPDSLTTTFENMTLPWADPGLPIQEILNAVTPITVNNSLSACLLYKDDNDIINEWLAYHYHTVRLRYILVAIDPTSETSPHSIFDRWRQHTDLVIETWTDQDFMTPNMNGSNFSSDLLVDAANKKHDTTAAMSIELHRRRQRVFLSKCLRHMKLKNRNLTLHIDTDEYVAVNPKNRQQALYEVQPPLLVNASSIFHYIQGLYENDYLTKKANIPCMSLPRLLFGSFERNASSKNKNNILFPALSDWNRTHFETLRWQYHSTWTDSIRNAQPKVLLDVSMIPWDDAMFGDSEEQLFSIHRPSYKRCRNMGQISIGSNKRFPIILHHYLGSWERYIARTDYRRSKEQYELKANVREGPDTWLTSWLEGFVQSLGAERARLLLPEYLL